MFNVDIGETRITLIVEQNGKDHKLIHTLRQPDAKEMMDYQLDKAGDVHVVKDSGIIVTPGKAIFPARVALYDKIAVKAEGYCNAEEKEIDCSKTKNWKEAIPPSHKAAVIQKWDPNERIRFEDEEKNL